MTDEARWRLLLTAIADDLWPLTVVRTEDGQNFQLMVNCNDTFQPAADGEVVPIGEEATILAIAKRPDGDRSFDLLAWVAQRRGLPWPYHWRRAP